MVTIAIFTPTVCYLYLCIFGAVFFRDCSPIQLLLLASVFLLPHAPSVLPPPLCSYVDGTFKHQVFFPISPSKSPSFFSVFF